jgi:hypothetical protein
MTMLPIVCPTCRIQFEKNGRAPRCPSCGARYREAAQQPRLDVEDVAAPYPLPLKASETLPGTDEVTLGDGDAESALAFVLIGVLLFAVALWQWNFYWSIPAVLFMASGAFTLSRRKRSLG